MSGVTRLECPHYTETCCLSPIMNSRLASLSLFIRLLQHRLVAVRVMQTAGALTYTTLLSLVPMVTVILSVMRPFLPFMKLGQSMHTFLLQNLLPERAGKVVATYALQFSEKATSLTAVGTIFLVVTAIMLCSTIDRTIASIWVVRRPRVWYVRIPVYWLALTLGPILFAASVVVTGRVMAVSLGVVDDPGWLRGLLNRTMTAILLAALFAFMFHVIPNRKLNRWHSLAGGVVAGLGLVLMQRIFGFYLSKLPNFTLIYGTFSVVPIFLIWIYLSWFVILLGAIIAAILPDFEMRSEGLLQTPAGRVVMAIRLLQGLIDAQRQGRVAWLTDLSVTCKGTQERAELMLEEMRHAGWVVRTEGGAWVLCVAAEAISLGDLVARLMVGVAEAPGGQAPMSPEDRTLLKKVAEQTREGLRYPVVDISGDGSGSK
jgi:membrane protein